MIAGFEKLLGGVAAAMAEGSRRSPWLVVVLCALLTAGSVFAAAAFLEVDTDADRILSPTLRVRQTNIALAEALPGLQNNLVVMVEADDPADARAAVEELAEVLAKDSERYPGVFLPGDAPYYEDFGLFHLEREDLDELATRVEESGPLLATLVDRPELPILLGALAHVIQDVDGLHSLGEDGIQILDSLTLAVERFNAGGHEPIAWDELLFEDLDAEWTSPQLLFVRPVGDLTQMEPVLDALAWTAGLAALAVGRLNALTSAFAVVYIGLGVDFGIHFALGYLEQRGRGSAAPEALHETGSRVGSSLAFCALTTAIGFYAFIPTDYTAVADMGIISGTGVFLGLLATLTFYPALITLGLGESRKLATSPLSKLEIRLPSFPIRYPRTVCAAAALVTLVSCTALAWVRFDTNTLNVRDQRVESVQALKDLLYDSELSVWTIEVLARDLAEASEVAARIEALEGVDHVNIVSSFLPDDQAARLALFEQMRSDLTAPIELTDDESGEGLDRMTALEYTLEGYGVALDIDAELRDDGGDDDPLLESAERLREVLLALNDRLGEEVGPREVDALEEDVFGELPGLLDDVADALPTRTVSLADLPGDLKSRYLAPDGRARVEVFSSTNLNEPGALERFSDLVHSVRPDAGGPAAGTVALARSIVSSLRQALATAVVVITLLLMVLWRSVMYTLITLTPLVVGSVATAAVSVFADIPFNFANIIVLPLILGIGVDSGIHLVHRHRTGLRGARNLLATSTASAVLFSALTTMSSFATLALSNHLGISSLAQMLTVGILLMLAANVLVLPAILALLDKR